MELQKEIEKRRTFAIISHPDAGKTTLTEKLLLFGGAIQTAGAVKSNKAKQHTASDFMEIEKQRGISVATSVMGFEYQSYKINLLDTPGHKDFAEDAGKREAFLKRKSADIAWDKDNRPLFLAESRSVLHMVKEYYPDLQFNFLSEKNLGSITK